MTFAPRDERDLVTCVTDYLVRPALGMTNSAASTISVSVAGCFIHFSTSFRFQLGALFYTFLNTAAAVSGLLCSCYILLESLGKGNWLISGTDTQERE